MKTTTQILESALAAGTTKAALPWRRTLALALLAGAFIALGGLLSIIAGAAAEAPAAKRLLSGAVFPIGLILIVTLGGELFTGNNAVLIPPLAAKRTSMPRVLANWALVWLGNFAGALAFVGLFVLGAGTLDAALGTTLPPDWQRLKSRCRGSPYSAVPSEPIGAYAWPYGWHSEPTPLAKNVWRAGCL